jgi:S1-C subfamily serine protease
VQVALVLGWAVVLTAWWLADPSARPPAKPVSASMPTRVQPLTLAPNGSAEPHPSGVVAIKAPGPAPLRENDAPDIRERNALIPIAQLTTSRPLAAEAFLQEVLLAAQPRGGFMVQAVEPDGIYDKMGLRSGDVIYTLDTLTMSEVDESSMISLMQQTQIEVNIYRNGTPMALRHALNVDEDPSLAELR